MADHRSDASPPPGPAIAGLAVLLFIALFWRLGAASFWDPDEAHYAQTTRELLATGDWLAPYYNGRPFFDKPILFYWLQGLPMSFLPDPETGARLTPAICGVLLVAVTGWFGSRLFGRAVGFTAALMLAVNPGMFGLARYAILDLPFTLFLFAGVATIAIALVEQRPRLEYAGYLLVGIANALKGPIALVLCGVTFALACVVSADARRRLLALRWVQGAVIALVPGVPWPAYMLWRYGGEFVDGYILNENIKLFATPMYAGQPGWYFYISIILVGMLPWTGLLLARGAETARAVLRREGPLPLPDVLLWSWILAVTLFFSCSQFKLDHYVFPTSPAMCVLCARTWHDARSGGGGTWTLWGVRSVGPTLMVAGGAVAIAALTLLDLGPSFLLVPAALLGAGLVATVAAWPGRTLPAWPVAPVLAMGILYIGAVGWVMPRLEEGKVIPDVARWVDAHAGPGDRIATFRLNRWNTAYRFYVNRPVTLVESDEEARHFFSAPGPYYIVTSGVLYDALRAAGVPLRVAYERQGRWVTSGRALWRRGGADTRFIVAVPGD
ncbi:MAG: ArnT family glycosyltransferase [Vicinamibacterales bacterium]